MYHFHQSQRSLANMGLNRLELCVAPPQIIFNLGVRTGNIWMTKAGGSSETDVLPILLEFTGGGRRQSYRLASV